MQTYVQTRSQSGSGSSLRTHRGPSSPTLPQAALAVAAVATLSVSLQAAPPLDLGLDTPLRPSTGYLNDYLRADDPYMAAWNLGVQYRARYEIKENGGATGAGSGTDFSAKPGASNMFGLVEGTNNAIAPGKRPLSSMSPTIVTRDGKLFMTAGAPGGSRIPTTVMQVILNVLDFGMNIQDAVDAPRIHHQWLPDKLSLERIISPDTVALLKTWGYDVDYAPGVVLAQVAAIVSDGGWLQGASDGRSGAGKAAGY